MGQASLFTPVHTPHQALLAGEVQLAPGFATNTSPEDVASTVNVSPNDIKTPIKPSKDLAQTPIKPTNATKDQPRHQKLSVTPSK